MDKDEFDRRLKDLMLRSAGRWKDLLVALGVERKVVDGKGQPCPMCGGRDRFQFTDKFGDGSYFCRACGGGNGFHLAKQILGSKPGELLLRLEAEVGVARKEVSRKCGGERMRRLANKTWCEAVPITSGDEVDRYLKGRGLGMAMYPSTLRCHPSLGYYETRDGRSVKVGEYPAMLAMVEDAKGQMVTLHRTYVRDGRKALGGQSKKLLSSGISGAAVRLAPASDELAVCEGLETGLAVLLSKGKPVWSAMNCGNLERLWIPPSIRRLRIYGDNDAGGGEFDGQASAYALARRFAKEAHRLSAAEVDVKVFIPRHDGTDWADVFVSIHGQAAA